MVIISQSCSISRQGKTGRTVYLKKRVSEAIAAYFPLSKDAKFDYVAEFNTTTEQLVISKDERL